MHPEKLANVLFVFAPFFGFGVNVLAEIALYKYRRWGLVALIVGGFVAGGVSVAAIVVAALLITQATSWPDSLAIVAAVFIVYGAGSFVLFAIINLGETSLRIRILQLLVEVPDGLTLAQVLNRYNDAKLREVRVERLLNNRQVSVIDGRLYSRRTPLFFAYVGIELLRHLVYGPRSGARFSFAYFGILKRLLPGLARTFRSLPFAVIAVFLVTGVASQLRHGSSACEEVHSSLARGRCFGRYGFEALSNNRFEEAISFYRAAINADLNPDLLTQLAQALAGAHRLREAVETLDRALLLANDDPSQAYVIIKERARLHRLSGNEGALKDDCRQLVILAPKEAAQEEVCRGVGEG